MKFDRNHRIATLVAGSLLALGVTAAQAAIPASERAVLTPFTSAPRRRG
jgi:hypothetical protein